MFITIFCLSVFAAWAGDLSVAHDLDVEILPAEKKLTGTDHMTIRAEGRDTLTFRLSEKIGRIDVKVNHRSREFIRQNDLLHLALKPGEQTDTVSVFIRYSGIFDDPVPLQPVNMDNPGFGVSASISETGSFLLSGSSWYPELNEGRARYRLKVRAPEGMIAVTAGQSQGVVTEGGKTVSAWQIQYPVEGLSLSVSPFIVREKKVDNVTIATYFLSPDEKLSDAYLEAAANYLSLYSHLFGPYPFSKFAVVENFFPTGYGFPSYTLLGGSVLRLPFILSSSLGHEIAHCWWGNGVFVDYNSGNWSEALTTYVSDYLTLERRSQSEAKDYRLQVLRNYATLVKPPNDFSLSRFTGRTDPVTKTIGYDKGAMVFHMLRKMAGEEAFWGVLQDVYRQRLFKKTAWKDWQQAFEKRMNQPLDTFFNQWVYREGAPRFYLDDVKTEHSEGKWKIQGRVVQQKPYYALSLGLVLENGHASVSIKINMTAEPSMPFEVDSEYPPQKLILDPDADVMRRLFEKEIPPSINSLKGSPAVSFVMADDSGPGGRRVAETLALSLGLKNYDFISERETHRSPSAETDLIIFGSPRNKELLRYLPAQAEIHAGAFQLNGELYSGGAGMFFGVFGHPYAADRVAALFWPPVSRYAETVARKITHYGKYSYLAFQRERNTAKGFWAVNDSPLSFRWGDHKK